MLKEIKITNKDEYKQACSDRNRLYELYLERDRKPSSVDKMVHKALNRVDRALMAYETTPR